MKKLFSIIFIIAVIGGVYSAGSKFGFPEKNSATVIQTGIEAQINKIGELASVEYKYTNADLVKDSLKIKNWNVPFTTKRFIVRYTGIIKAGYETSKIKAKVGEGKIYITLPEAKILSHEIDEKSLEVLDESKNIFNPITIEDYNTFQIAQKKFTEEKAISDGLFNEAENNIKEMINLAISSVKGIDDYEVVFK